MVIYARAPVRLEFGGGGTDMFPYDSKHTGKVLNATINYYSYASVEPSKDNKFYLVAQDLGEELVFDSLDDIEYNGKLDLMKGVCKVMRPIDGLVLTLRSDISPNSGLGNSASASVAMIGALNRYMKLGLTLHDIAEYAFDVEDKEIQNVGGRQDQYAAVFGGINLMEFHGDNNVKINPLNLSFSSLNTLEKNLFLIFIDKRGDSGSILESQIKTYNTEKKVKILGELKTIASDMYYDLISDHLNDFGKKLYCEWQIKKRLNPNISNPKIDSLLEMALDGGALGGRLMGAGQGGHMILFCPNNKAKVLRLLREENVIVRNFRFESLGLTTWELRQ